MIRLNSLTGATVVEAQQINNALIGLNILLPSDLLKQAILAHTKFDSSLGFENTDDTNQQVWDAIQKGDVEIDDSVYSVTFWERIRGGNNVVGYEDEDGSIHENRYFLDDATMAYIAANIIHEVMHKLGYSHDFNPTAIRPYSVPYGVQQIVETLLTKYPDIIKIPATAAAQAEAPAQVCVSQSVPETDEAGA